MNNAGFKTITIICRTCKNGFHASTRAVNRRQADANARYRDGREDCTPCRQALRAKDEAEATDRAMEEFELQPWQRRRVLVWRDG